MIIPEYGSCQSCSADTLSLRVRREASGQYNATVRCTDCGCSATQYAHSEGWAMRYAREDFLAAGRFLRLEREREKEVWGV